jgi:hypothetical protein
MLMSSILFIFPIVSALGLDFDQSLINAASKQRPIDQQEVELKLKSQNYNLLAIGESHHYTKFYHQLTGPLIHAFANKYPTKTRLCSESIDQFLNSPLLESLNPLLLHPSLVVPMSPRETPLSECRIKVDTDRPQAYLLYTGFHHHMPLYTLYPNSFFQSVPVNTQWEQSSLPHLPDMQGVYVQGMELAYLFEERINLVLKSARNQEGNHSLRSLFIPTIRKIKRLERKLLLDSSSKEYFYGHFNLTKEMKNRFSALGWQNPPQYYDLLLLNPHALQGKVTNLLSTILKQKRPWKRKLLSIMRTQKIYYGQSLLGEGTIKGMIRQKNLQNEWICHYANLPNPISCYSQMLTFKKNGVNHLMIHEPEMNKNHCFHDGQEVLFSECL